MAKRFRIDAPAVDQVKYDATYGDTPVDPRVARILADDPTFDPTGKSDTYLDTRVRLLDEKQ